MRRLLAGVGIGLSWLLAAPASAQTPIQIYVEAMQPGWNLGNTLDATPTETSWGNPLVTQAFIQQIKAQGFKSIRIPVTWDPHLGPGPNYTINAAWLNRVQQVVDWSLGAGFYVMLNLHHDSYWVRAMPANHDAVLAKFNALWSQLAPRFRDYPATLMLESINEPTFDGADDATQMALLRELNISFFNIVRGSGGGNATRPLVLPSLNTNSGQPYLDSLKATMAALNDPNLIATTHYYGYWPFSVNIAGVTTVNEAVINDINASFDNTYNTFVAHGIPVVMGEVGLLSYNWQNNAVERGEMLKFFELYTAAARSKNITWQLWDAGGQFNRTTYQWRDPELFSYYMQGLTSRSSTGATDLIFVETGAPVDTAIPLNLNGNLFVSLTQGATPLTPGVDYTIQGDLLTVKASALTAYATGSYGEKTVLTANFSAGLPWRLHVRHHVAPALGVAAGTKAGGIRIPTAFNGDLVATMEASYVGRGYPYPGPAEWTSFKEFNYAYLPDYPNNRLEIKREFFAETTNDPIELTLHFWSGRTAVYRLTSSASGAVQGAGVAPAWPEFIWASFTVGESGTWLPPELIRSWGGSFSATGLPAWAQLDSATGQISGTPDTPAGQITPVKITVSGLSGVLETMTLNLVSAAPGADLAPVNMSSRGRAGRGEQVLIPGFVVNGSTPRTFLIRAVGPAMSQAFPTGAGLLADPTLRIFDQAGVELVSNDNWSDGADPEALRNAFREAGASAFDTGSKDAALLVTLQPGLYSAHAAGKDDTTGIALVELYDRTEATHGSSLVNLSTRAFVGSGDEVLIPGIVLQGAGTRQILVRALGPALTPAGVQGVLADPRMILMKGSQALATNDDWAVGTDAAELQAVFSRVGASPLPVESKDAAMLTTLPHGAYTIVVQGNGNTTGVALVEVYIVP